MTPKILFVDDDPTILESYKRFVGLKYRVDTALGGKSGLQLIARNGPYAVVVSDMRMPGMDGNEFLAKVHALYPKTVRMLLTGQADMEDAIGVVNHGQIFRFLTKPCPPEVFKQALCDAIRQYRLIQAEKELLEKTLQGTVKLLTDIVSIINPELFSHSKRTRTISSKIAKHLNLKHQWKVEIAAMLSQIGCITAPAEILEKKYRYQPLSENENEIFLRHLLTGKELIGNIPRLEDIAEAIAYQGKNYDGSGFPTDHKKGDDIPVIARILKVAMDFNTYMAMGLSEKSALGKLKVNANYYDPGIVSSLESTISNSNEVYAVREITADEITTGMVLAEDLRTKTNLLLVGKCNEVSETMKICIANFAANRNVVEPVKILLKQS